MRPAQERDQRSQAEDRDSRDEQDKPPRRAVAIPPRHDDRRCRQRRRTERKLRGRRGRFAAGGSQEYQGRALARVPRAAGAQQGAQHGCSET